MLELIEVKRFTPLLLRKVADFETENFGPAGLDEWTFPIFAKYGKVFVLSDNEEIRGVAELIKDWADPALAFIVGVSIGERFRKQGLGTMFLKTMLERLANDGVTKVRLTVAPANKEALSVYGKVGFVKVGFSRDEYGETEDRLVLEADLSSSAHT